MSRFFSLLTPVWLVLASHAQAEETALPHLIQVIPLSNVEGRLDHLAADLQAQRLFVAARGNNTLEVLDLKTGTWTRRVSGLREPQGVTFLPEVNQVVVTNGADGVCAWFDGDSFQRLRDVKLSSDADNVRYDPVTQQLYIGYGNGGVGIMNAVDGRIIGNITLSGHPESFQLERSGARMFVNVPGANQIAVVDREQRRTIAVWANATASTANFPMALDETRHRLFVGFRAPVQLVAFDTESGASVASLDSVGDADEVFYDAQRKRIYVSGGEGFLQVIQQVDANTYRSLAKIPTAPGARTALFVPERHQLYLAVPRRGTQRAEIRVYDVQP